MDRLTKKWGSNPAVPCNFDLGFIFDLDNGTYSGLQEVFERLAAYEETGLEPEVCAEYKKFEDEVVRKGVTFQRIVELMEAEKDGRLVVLPFSQGQVLLDRSYPERPDLLKNFRVAISYEHCGIIFHQPLNIFMDNVSKGFISQVSEETNAALKGSEKHGA